MAGTGEQIDLAGMSRNQFVRIEANSFGRVHDRMGLIQAPRYRFVDDFAAGTLTEVLADYPPSPTPLVALYPQNRQLSPRVRVFLDWAIGIFASVDL
ncbi:LysR substrate-binding domain-containing protein [Salmonella enterica]|uniref:LysR substrate-binding domain-containing protein n=1 Tax=Salmonella enterica TaxID=28901 RepID=UPI00280A9E87|nr:LysR substrate-binding domain-containing protein [Salmonella enterica]